MSSPRRLLPFLAIAFAVSPLGCGEDAEPEGEVVRPVKMVVFGGSGREDRFSYPGRVFPNTTVGIAFEVTGKLQELPVTKGQEVRAGDLLAKLDQRDFSNDLAAAEAAFEEAEATRRRYAEAAAKRAVSQRELDEAVARARIAESELKIRKKALEDTVIHADFDGIVSDRYVENFQQIQAKQPIMELQEISVLEIRVDIPEKDAVAPEDAEGGRITAVFDAVPDREFDLEVKEFVTEADPITQTFSVTLKMENPDESNLLPGMTATVHYYPPEARAGRGDTTLPAVAVLGQPDREPWVWVIDADTMVVSKRPVKVGAIVAGERIRIESGLEPGETIASAGAHHLAEGMKVREYAR